MVETLRIEYTRLVEVRLLHHFWLDDGATVFDRITDDAVKTRRLLAYDARRVLTIEPGPATAATIAGLGGMIRPTRLGFIVAVPEDAVIPLDETFEFFVIAVAPDYAAYTAQPLARRGTGVPALAPQPIVDVDDPTPDPETGVRRTVRFKANVPVLSNLTGALRTLGGATTLFLSRDYPGPGANDVVDALYVVGSDLRQRSGDPPNAAFHVIGPWSQLPVYVHQGDVPATAPPAGSVGAPAFGIDLTPDTPSSVSAVVQLVPRRPSGPAVFDFALSDGSPRPRVFDVRLQNRWTTWRYHERDGTTSVEAQPLPHTHLGNAGTRPKPAWAAVGAEFDASTPPRITRLVSDIYV